MDKIIRTQLCKSFQKRSKKTWNLLSDERLTTIKIGEETITDLNLQKIQKRNQSIIKIQKFSKQTESKNGADWEWWFCYQNYCFGCRVQAKKLDLQTLLYPQIDRLVGSTTTKQIDLLVSSALSNNPKLFPLYVFYNYFNAYQIQINWNCVSFNNIPYLLGCSMLPAEILLNFDISSVGIIDIQSEMKPWHCLVCCEGFQSKNPDKTYLPFKVFNFIKYGFIKSKMTEMREEDFIHEKIPDYVLKVIKNQQLDNEEWEKIGVKGVMVIVDQ